MTLATITGADTLATTLEGAAERLPGQMFTLTRKYGLLAQTKIRANMSGRSGVIFQGEGDEAAPPGEIGPRAISGDLRRSVTLEMSTDGVQVAAVVYSNAPQALRLELGFVGEDALGRVYDQTPYPAWRPAFDALKDAYQHEVSLLGAIGA